MLNEILNFILSDKFGFSAFEVLFLLTFFYALWKDKISSCWGVVSAVIRGEKSRNIFITSAFAFLTFLISVIFQLTTYPQSGRILLYLINLAVVIYLFFYSRWFTNKLVKWWQDFEQRRF